MSVIRGDKVRLSALRQDDVPAFLEWSEDEEYIRYLRVGPIKPDNEKDLRTWIDEHHNARRSMGFTVRPLDDDTPLGFVMLMDIEWTHQTATIAIAIGPEHHGQGYGADAMETLLRFAFNELNFFRVQLYVFQYNRRAIGLYEKLGFVREGILRKALARDGRRYDVYLFALLREEWAAARVDVLPPPIGEGE